MTDVSPSMITDAIEAPSDREDVRPTDKSLRQWKSDGMQEDFIERLGSILDI